MISPLSSFSRIIQSGLNQLYWRDEPEIEGASDDWKYPKKKPPPHVPQPPAEGCPINSLPPEILSWIFVLGQQMELDSESSHGTDDSDNNSDDSSVESILVDDSFQVTVSHVCKHWREVALDTPALWSEIDVETGRQAAPSYRRASAYLSRTKEYPLSISIDVNDWDPDDESVYSEPSDHHPPETSAQLQEIMDLLLPHTSRWRKFKLAAESYFYFHTALVRLRNAPPASLLEFLELHHFDEDEELEPGPHFFPYPSHKTPFVLFGNNAPKLQHVSLYGVHIDWHNTSFLKNLHSFELAYHSQDVRPSFDEFFTILRSSPGLRTLDLCMSGPFGFPHEWPAFLPPPPHDDRYHDPHVPVAFATQPSTLDEYMTLSRLHELKLSYQSPEELAGFLSRVSMPSLHTLEINFEDHEYTEFIQSHLISPPRWQGGSSRESRLTNLKELKIVQLPCTPKAIAELYATLVNLETIELDFNTLDEPFWEVFIPTKVPGVTMPVNQLLPALHTMKVRGSSGDVLRQIVGARIEAGLPLQKLYIDFGSMINKEDDGWLREKVDGLEYFEGSDEDDYTDDESVGSIIEVEMDGFHL
ncbi:hypothetical protein BJ322DRAFT_1010446 [Thelephora terrestris]|uniref:F-box domain-containing protein n=1 Tax=Thelephora terrestris TaxID=56493 RepID=A0A9P6HAD7_9AGAM|nr:hypothetical protein BJ322DRAFT_1010446 [Thelephora terrestris]